VLENERNLLLQTEHHLQRKLQQQKEEEQAIREKLEVMNNNLSILVCISSCFDYFTYAEVSNRLATQNADLGCSVSVAWVLNAVLYPDA